MGIYNWVGSALLTLYILACQAQAQPLSTVPPAKSGVDSQVLERLSEHLQQHGSESMLIVHKGNIVFQWGDIHQKHLINSIRKPMLNALYGLYVDRGIIDIHTTLAQLDIDDIDPKLTNIEKSATIADLLKSRSGIYHDAGAESEWMRQQKPVRGSHKPGEHHYYNNWDFNALGTIFEKLTGKKIFEAYYQEIAKPLGMQQFKGKYVSLIDNTADDAIPKTDGFYQYESKLSRHPAYHFRMSSYDMALFGQLYVNGGKWNGKQLISKEWIDDSATAYSITNEEYRLGYGMLWAVVYPKADQTKPGSLYHTGAGVQMLGVYPSQDMVFVHRVNTEKPYKFQHYQIYPIIKMVFASLPKDKTASP